MHDTLNQALKRLRLSGLRDTLPVRLQEAAANRLGHAEFLELLLQDELNLRADRQLGRNLKAAAFPAVKTLDQFDWSFNECIDRRRIFDLAAGQFIRQRQDILFLGPPGVGKTHLAVAIGQQAVRAGFTVYYRSVFDLVRDFLADEAFNTDSGTLNRYLRPDLLIIDDMGLKQLPRHSAEYLLELIVRRHENRSTIMTSNRPIEDWGILLGDVPAAGAILDRFLQRAAIFTITGRSYRLKGRSAPGGKDEDPGHATELPTAAGDAPTSFRPILASPAAMDNSSPRNQSSKEKSRI